MKRIILILVLISSVLLVGCQHERYRINREFEADYFSGMELDMLSSVGNISVENWEKDYISIKAKITGRANTTSKAKEMAYETEIDFNYQDDDLIIRAITPESSYSGGATVAYAIKIPKDFGGVFESSTGNISIDTAKRGLDITTSTGNVNINRLKGDLNVETSTGGLMVDYLKGQANVETSTGNIKGNFDLIPGSNNLFDLSTGNVDINLFNQPSLEVLLTTNTGNININQLSLELDRMDDDHIQGRIGDGEAKLKVNTSTGNINISNKN